MLLTVKADLCQSTPPHTHTHVKTETKHGGECCQGGQTPVELQKKEQLTMGMLAMWPLETVWLGSRESGCVCTDKERMRCSRGSGEGTHRAGSQHRKYKG